MFTRRSIAVSFTLVLCAAIGAIPSIGQSMAGMQMDQSGGMNMQPQSLIQEIIRHNLSGTGVEPDSTPVPMLMTHKGQWTLMFHANVFLLDEQQTSPRGADKFFST